MERKVEEEEVEEKRRELMKEKVDEIEREQ